MKKITILLSVAIVLFVQPLMPTSSNELNSMKPEIEVKFFVDKSDFETRLHKLGATLAAPRRLMRRQLFAFPLAMRKATIDQQARVRDEGNKITMTLKESAIPKTMSSVRELEIEVSDFDAAVQIFVMSGYEPTTYQENYRTSWIFDGSHVEIDEWPGLPAYAEIEAPSEEELKRIAALLGIDETSFMTCSVFVIYKNKLNLDDQKMRRLDSLTFENFTQVTKNLYLK